MPIRDQRFMDENDNKEVFEHRWWHIVLIIFAVIAFIVTCVFNGLASTGRNGKH